MSGRGRIAIAIALCAACGPKPPPASTADLPGSGDLPANQDPSRAGAPPSGGPAGNDRAEAPPAPGPVVAALAGDGAHAFVADASGLIEVAPSGKTLAITTTRPGWCATDARGQVVWFIGDGGLLAFDLVDRRVHTIVRGDVAADTYVLDWGNQQLGGESKVQFQLGLALHLAATPAPTLGSEIGCDGDQAVYCYGDEAMQTLNADLAARQASLDGLRFADPAYVAMVAQRGAKGSLWTPPPVPPVAPARKPKVDRRACEEDKASCGELTAIPASPLWLVVTENSRGDFFHESRELWDPATGEFISVGPGGLTRAKKPKRAGGAGGYAGDYGDLRVSPTGAMSIDGLVFDASHVVYRPQGDGAITCGWTTGGWRIPGPTG